MLIFIIAIIIKRVIKKRKSYKFEAMFIKNARNTYTFLRQRKHEFSGKKNGFWRAERATVARLWQQNVASTCPARSSVANSMGRTFGAKKTC